MPASYRAVPVWDGVVRFCHWWNAGFVLVLLAVGSLIYFQKALQLQEGTVDTLTDVHAMAGFALAAGLVVRIAYLFTGEGPGNWRDVLPHTKVQFALARDTLLYYLRGFKGECPLYFAHNPLAGMAYSGFFVLAVWQVTTGSAMYLLGEGVTNAYAHAGHVHAANTWPPEWLVELHEVGALLILLFIAAHLSALVLHELLETRGLMSSMVSGNKFFTEDEIAELGQSETGTDDAGDVDGG